MTIMFLEVIENIQCSIFIMRTVFQYTSDRKNIFPTPLLAYMVTYTIAIATMNIEVVSDIKYHIHILHLEESFIRQRQQHNCNYLC